VCFNRSIRRVFKYNDWESVKDIMFGFNVLPMDLFLNKSNLCFLGNALRSNRVLVRKCANWYRSKDETIAILLEYGINFHLSKNDIVECLWKCFSESVKWM
jgi:hypothetical protein